MFRSIVNTYIFRLSANAFRRTVKSVINAQLLRYRGPQQSNIFSNWFRLINRILGRPQRKSHTALMDMFLKLLCAALVRSSRLINCFVGYKRGSLRFTVPIIYC